MELARLESREELREILYHLRGILEASGKIADLAQRLDETIDADHAKALDVLALLEVEIFHQLDYHASELRTPWAELVERMNSRRSDIEKASK